MAAARGVVPVLTLVGFFYVMHGFLIPDSPFLARLRARVDASGFALFIALLVPQMAKPSGVSHALVMCLSPEMAALAAWMDELIDEQISAGQGLLSLPGAEEGWAKAFTKAWTNRVHEIGDRGLGGADERVAILMVRPYSSWRTTRGRGPSDGRGVEAYPAQGLEGDLEPVLSDRLTEVPAESREALRARRPVLGEPGQVSFEGVELLGSDLRRPAVPHLGEERRAESHHVVAAGRDAKSLDACVAWIGLPLDVSESFESGDRLGGGLFGHRQPAAEFRGRVRSLLDGAQGEFVGCAYAFVSAACQFADYVVHHRLEAAEQQERKLSAW